MEPSYWTVVARARKRERTRSRPKESSMLDYEKLDVYRTALEFVITSVEIRDRLPRNSWTSSSEHPSR